MPEIKPFASLSSGLLARKGAARPAMRPQLQLSYDEQRRVLFGAAAVGDLSNDAAAHEDLGWNDMGFDYDDAPSVEAPPVETQAVDGAEPTRGPEAEAARPEVLKQIDALAEKMAAPVASLATMARPSRRGGAALQEGRKAAFTLRLDADRHLRLRLASALQNASAQSLVIDALDHLLDALPGLDELTEQARKA